MRDNLFLRTNAAYLAYIFIYTRMCVAQAFVDYEQEKKRICCIGSDGWAPVCVVFSKSLLLFLVGKRNGEVSWGLHYNWALTLGFEARIGFGCVCAVCVSVCVDKEKLAYDLHMFADRKYVNEVQCPCV